MHQVFSRALSSLQKLLSVPSACLVRSSLDLTPSHPFPRPIRFRLPPWLSFTTRDFKHIFPAILWTDWSQLTTTAGAGLAPHQTLFDY